MRHGIPFGGVWEWNGVVNKCERGNLIFVTVAAQNRVAPGGEPARGELAPAGSELPPTTAAGRRGFRGHAAPRDSLLRVLRTTTRTGLGPWAGPGLAQSLSSLSGVVYQYANLARP